MSVVVYIAQVTGNEGQGYTAGFPDLPGVTAAARTTPDLLREARQRLLQELKRLEAGGAEWPSPSSMEQLRAGAAGAEGLLMLIDTQVDDAPMRVNISIGERLLKRIDEAAESQSLTRSGFIAAAARQRLGDEAAQASSGGGEDATQRIYDELAAMGRRMNETLGPDSAFGRTLTELDNRALEGLRKLAGNVASAVERHSRRTSDPASDQRAGEP